MPEFDYIIVGAGSAGGVRAARLSEDADLRVPLIVPRDGRITGQSACRQPWLRTSKGARGTGATTRCRRGISQADASLSHAAIRARSHPFRAGAVSCSHGRCEPDTATISRSCPDDIEPVRASHRSS